MTTDVADPPAALQVPRTRGGGSTLGRYILIRFLLIFPTVLILVTLVFFLIRLTGDPITAALGGRLPADQLAERIREAGTYVDLDLIADAAHIPCVETPTDHAAILIRFFREIGHV